MNKFKKRILKFLDLFFVRKCVSCGELLAYDSDEYLCGECKVKWKEEKNIACSQCGKRQSQCTCGFGKKYVDSVRHLAIYDPEDREKVANNVVYALKKSNVDLVFEFVAREMKDTLVGEIDPKDTVCTNVPRSPKSIKIYGYDHAKKLADFLADELGIEYVDILRHSGGKTEQKTLNKEQRILNAREKCFVRKEVAYKIKGKTVLLVDDIGTTGAMTGVCAELLHGCGAKSVRCVLFAKNMRKGKM